MEAKTLGQEKEQALIAELAQEMQKTELTVLTKHGLKLAEAVLLLKSYALAQSVKYAILCGVSKEQMLQEDGLVYDVMLKQFETAEILPFKQTAEGAKPSA